MRLKFLHWSDTHNSKATLPNNNVIATSDSDFSIHCGDMVADYFEQSISSLDLTSTLCVIGNHDALLGSGVDPAGYHWEMQPTQNQLRDKFILPAINNFGVISPEGKTWWHYIIKNVMVIGLNDTCLTSNAKEQNLWLQERLTEAENENMPVIICKHGPCVQMSNVTCNWSVSRSKNGETAEITDYSSMYSDSGIYIKTITESRAKVICILHGHDHWDVFSTLTKSDKNKIPVIGIGSVVNDSYNDLYRTNTNYLSSVIINEFIFDDKLNSLEIYRLGACGSLNGCKRKMLVWNYETNNIVSMCSPR